MSVINTNITAMVGQQNLSKSEAALGTSMERLSSGLRINSAKDDAAGQAIANRMSSQVTGLSQAQRNANDGISVAQTAEGALNQVNDNLQRVRELTVQAQNGTNSQDDLASIQDEINQRLSEIDRISEETSFNGTDVLASDQTVDIQVGSADGQTISIDLAKTNSEALDLAGFSVTGPQGATTAATTAQVENNTGFENVTGANVKAFTGDDLGIANENVKGSSTLVADEEGNMFAKVTINSSGLSSEDRAKLEDEGLNIDPTSSGQVFHVALDDNDASISEGVVTYDATEGADVSSLTSARAGDPLASLDSAIKQVDNQRSDLGAIQNRFDSAITNLETTETNLTAARSRIEDADYADEVSDMTRAQILQQAGTSVLAQANQVPQNVLSLLG
ncbi:FliC/FljB family flagellin [Halomonas sp. YLGW01]|uniref:FliC/FljB family flagellin n=1 Tax=Halomonas sp. YLGW01 TaxID=2773308 RepID=UPI00177B9AF4|nr:FliC/FljB family flagellin [Halomonas sp. YLGW01]